MAITLWFGFFGRLCVGVKAVFVAHEELGMTHAKARWEQSLSEYVKNPRLPEWESPPIPLAFDVVDSAFNRHGLRPEWLDAWGIENVSISEPDEYHKRYSIMVLSDKPDTGIVFRTLPKESVGEVTVIKMSHNRTKLSVKATGHNNDLVKLAVTTFFSNWIAEREVDRGGYWEEETDGEKTAVSPQLQPEIRSAIINWDEILSIWAKGEDFPLKNDRAYDRFLLQNFQDVEFRQVFTEWFNQYYNPHPYPPSDDYLAKIAEYAHRLAGFFPEEQEGYWEVFFRYAMLELSKDDETFTISLPTNSLTFDPQKAHRRTRQLLYASSLSPLLNIEEKVIPEFHYTYIVSYRTIELCRIEVDYGDMGSWNMISTWRTQTIPDDVERDFVLIMVNRIFYDLLSLMQEKQVDMQNTAIVSGISEQRTTGKNRTVVKRTEFLQQLKKAFNDDDLATLCFELNISYDDLAGQNRERRFISLIDQLERENRIHELIEHCKQKRPHCIWDSFVNL